VGILIRFIAVELLSIDKLKEKVLNAINKIIHAA
jgi:hypothetical protein